MSNPILLFVALDAVALVLLGGFGTDVQPAVARLLAMLLAGLGMLASIGPLLMRAPAAALTLPVGPPGLAPHLALDSLSMVFLAMVFLAGLVTTAFPAMTAEPRLDAGPRTIAFCLAGTVLALLAADGMTLVIGLGVTCGAIRFADAKPNRGATLLVPFLMLAAVCLLAPVGFAPRFDAIRAAPIDPARATAAAALTAAAVVALIWHWSEQRCWVRNALTGGVLIPLGCYLLLRMIADLAAAANQTTFGFVLLLGGGTLAVVEGWLAARHDDIDGSVLCLIRRQAGLAAAGIGLALITRAADLPGAAAFAFAASFLSAVGAVVAGVLTTLAAHAIGTSAGTWRLSRLGGLVQAMPASSAALTMGLLGLSTLPPGLGFVSLWLLFESIRSAPRTGGLLFQLPLALIGGAVALSAALAAAASVRLLGTAVLGRPRTPQGAGARESKSTARSVLLALAGLCLVAGLLPGPITWAFGEPAIRALSGTPPGGGFGLSVLLPSISSPSCPALSVFALLTLATAIVLQVPRWSRMEAKTAGVWADGMEPPPGLPFGDPAAQSAGEGFVPALSKPRLPRSAWPQVASLPAASPGLPSPGLPSPGLPSPGVSSPGLPSPDAASPAAVTPGVAFRLAAWRPAWRQVAWWVVSRPLSGMAGLWIVLAGFTVLLLVLAVTSG
ncbi:hypothetical protein [Rhodopila sp.]|uniref:hypothetical protein n=1 Tax=Rhodopila sp. TaxID=2480087 RepID=UPI003D1343C9